MPGPTTGEVQATWDYVSGFTPVEPIDPAPGGFVAAGAVVAGPSAGVRYRLRIAVYAGYTYEVDGNPTLADLEWQALAFSLTHTVTADGTLDIFVTASAAKGFYKVTFRVPGANVGTP